ncbi:MAG: hypothetical protein AAF502_12770 [Bacteroidota bacterium]
MDLVLLHKFAHLIQDSGPLYHEFNPDAWIKEPWNAFSSLFFFVPVLFWTVKLYGKYMRHGIITLLLPLLFLNGLGSTLYHAFRASDFFLVLDFLPAMIMSIILSLYMWKVVTGAWWKGMTTVMGFYGVGYLTITLLGPHIPSNATPNIGYFFSGSCFLLPFLILLVRTRFFKWYLVVLTFVFLIGALLFRMLDYPTPNPFPEWMPQGTHFLWHIMSALAVFSLGYYLFFLKEQRPDVLESVKS